VFSVQFTHRKTEATANLCQTLQQIAITSKIASHFEECNVNVKTVTIRKKVNISTIILKPELQFCSINYVLTLENVLLHSNTHNF